MHSAFSMPSFYAGKDVEIESDNVTMDIDRAFYFRDLYWEARDVYYPDGMPGYEEIGSTAYITFDDFTKPTVGVNYYTTPPDEDPDDTFELIFYAHSQIMRENSPIENVVIDLSNNMGGEADAAMLAIGWFLGECNYNVNNTLTGGQTTTQYFVDTNLDHKFDESDTLASKNLYCIISQNSFSYGNLLPAAFKDSGNVTLLGERSGGGICVVWFLTAADGTLFRISGTESLSTVLNGSFYDIDRGIEPDVPIIKLDNFYNRTALTEFINELY